MAPRFAFVPARWLAPDSGLTPTDRLTLCVLCQWVNRESGECFPSVATIAAHAALSENSVRSAIKRLVVLGAVQVERELSPQLLSAPRCFNNYFNQHEPKLRR